MGSKSGTLNAKDAWNFLHTPKPQVPWKGWAWDPGQIPCHSYTTWLALLNKLPTKSRDYTIHHMCGYSSFFLLSLLAKMGLLRNASRTLLGWVEILDQLHLQPAMVKVVKDLIETFEALSHLEDWSISHTYREANAPADLLAARQSSLGSTIIYTQDIWTEVEDSLLKDKQGTIFKRKIADLTDEENLH
ncbi:hypothetical protein QJS10_CPA05g01763 [Acorus calamus]|uniref:RNase H type-1 domain-containing protein n=1 Tax=Acorus calamus TaxID=4465 RepID=A0AAV9EVK1_ACOCL|nr:hypothetical protein QJS10_CPA05g01763 [Acorus calamus]